MAKNAPTVQSENAPKRVKMAKMEKIVEKIDFLYNNFPEKVISLRKCTKIFFAFGEKKSKIFSRLRREFWSCVETPPAGGGQKFFPPHSHTATHPYTAACIGPVRVTPFPRCGRSPRRGRPTLAAVPTPRGLALNPKISRHTPRCGLD